MSYLSYHEGTTPVGGGAFQSLTDALDPAPAIVPKTHFVEWFSGDALDSIWTFDDITGTNSGAMVDGVDSGYAITTATTSFANAQIDFNNINHYDESASVCIGVVKNDSTTSNELSCGLASTETNQLDYAYYRNASGTTNLHIHTADSSSAASVESSIARDTNWHKTQVTLQASSAILHIDDVLEAIATSNLPTIPQQPIFGQRSRTTAAKIGYIRYLEVYSA